MLKFRQEKIIEKILLNSDSRRFLGPKDDEEEFLLVAEVNGNVFKITAIDHSTSESLINSLLRDSAYYKDKGNTLAYEEAMKLLEVIDKIKQLKNHCLVTFASTNYLYKQVVIDLGRKSILYSSISEDNPIDFNNPRVKVRKIVR